jgi:hypothetical protein
MPTVFVHGAYRIVVYLNDHAPAHVHAVGPDGNARFLLGDGPEEVRLVDVDGIGKKDLRGLAAEVIDRHEECLTAWRSIHGN